MNEAQLMIDLLEQIGQRDDAMATLCAEWAADLVSDSVTPDEAVDRVLRRSPVPLDRSKVLALVMGMLQESCHCPRPSDKEPLRIDLVIVRPDGSPEIDEAEDPIGAFLTKHNIVTYTSPDATFNVHAFVQSFVYALLYMMENDELLQLKFSDFSISAFVDSEPVKLFSYLQERFKWNRSPISRGIYHFNDGWVKMQIVVTSQIDPSVYPYFAVLTKQLTIEKWDAFCERARQDYEDPRSDKTATKNHLLAILNVVEANNPSFFSVEGRDKVMNAAKLISDLLEQNGQKDEALQQKDDDMATLCAEWAADMVSESVTPDEAVDRVLRRSPAPLDRAKVLALVLGML